MASYGRPSLLFASPETLQTLQTLKNLKTLKTLTWHASSCSQQPPQGHTWMASYGPLKQSLGVLHPAANSHPKATHQSRLMGVQACRLPALKPSKPSKPLKTLKRWLGMLHPAANSHPKVTKRWLGNPPPRPHINGFFWASKPAVCQPLNSPNPPNPPNAPNP